MEVRAGGGGCAAVEGASSAVGAGPYGAGELEVTGELDPGGGAVEALAAGNPREGLPFEAVAAGDTPRGKLPDAFGGMSRGVELETNDNRTEKKNEPRTQKELGNCRFRKNRT